MRARSSRPRALPVAVAITAPDAPAPDRETQEYTQREKLHLTTLGAVDFDALHVRGTPTVILVDKSGRVLDFWVGKLSTDDQQRILQTLGMS